MKMKVKTLNLDAGGKSVCIINKKDAMQLGVHPLERVVIKKNRKKTTVIVNTAHELVKPSTLVAYKEVQDLLKLKNKDIVEVKAREPLESKKYIKKKVHGKNLNYKEIRTIFQDVIERDLNDLELASFITALEINGSSIKESYYMTKAMVETGKQINFGVNTCDKHSIGSIPGDKTSLLLVPIIAASGIKIPKTSSRAIVDPAGTADRMEVFADICFSINEIKNIVKKTNGCIVWGGLVNLAPADDLFIDIESPLSMDPLLIPSVLGKKKAVGSDYVVIDMPTGPHAKIYTKKDCQELSKRFTNVGKKLGMKIKCVSTDARQPLGYALGPNLEAREALGAIIDFENTPIDIKNKLRKVAGTLLKMAGKKPDLVDKLWLSGKCEEKFREIIKAQKGDENIKPEKIKIGKYKKEVKSKKSGKVKAIDNKKIVDIARTAGAPKDKEAGVLLNKKIGHSVKKGELLFTIYSKNKNKLKTASKKENPMVI